MKMEAWWTTLDLTICCSHVGSDWSTIQIGDVDDNGSYFTCPECGQKYFVFLKIAPLEEEEYA